MPIKHVINLYTTIGCPKCNVLRNKCAKSDIIANSDFEEVIIDPSNKDDTDLQLLIEHNITQLPVLLVDNTFMNFNEAMSFIK